MEADFQKITLQVNGLCFSALELGEGPLVLCLHGFPDNNATFMRQQRFLAAQGFRTVAPLLRGYEASSQSPAHDYHVLHLAQDVLGWLEALGTERAHLIGHDWGAVTAYAACALAPERFYSLTTLSIPHLRHLLRGLIYVPQQLYNSWYVLFFQWRGLADWALESQDWALLERLWRSWSPSWEPPAEVLERVKVTFRQPGVKQAALGYYRDFFDLFSAEGRASFKLCMAPIQVPTFALTGEKGGCLDTRLFEIMRESEDFPAGLRIERLAEAGHFLHLECPEAVNGLILEWLRESSPKPLSG